MARAAPVSHCARAHGSIGAERSADATHGPPASTRLDSVGERQRCGVTGLDCTSSASYHRAAHARTGSRGWRRRAASHGGCPAGAPSRGHPTMALTARGAVQRVAVHITLSRRRAVKEAGTRHVRTAHAGHAPARASTARPSRSRTIRSPATPTATSRPPRRQTDRPTASWAATRRGSDPPRA